MATISHSCKTFINILYPTSKNLMQMVGYVIKHDYDRNHIPDISTKLING